MGLGLLDQLDLGRERVMLDEVYNSVY